MEFKDCFPFVDDRCRCWIGKYLALQLCGLSLKCKNTATSASCG
nr:hypothetical protein [uncultured Methanobrevibacter sp.]